MPLDLLMDIGNTQTVVGVYHVTEKLESWRFSSKLFQTEDEIASLIRNFLKFKDIEFKHIERLIISSVVPELSFVLERFSQKYFRQAPIFVTSKLKMPIQIKYRPKESVGADRISASVAAFDRYKTNLIIIDFGTATTFDVVRENGDYLGGVIALGIEGQINALHKNASKLPKVNLEIPTSFIGNTTDLSIQSGVLRGNIEMVRGMIKGIKDELGHADIKVIATGGLASLINKHIPEIDAVDSDLVLKGMLILMELQ